MKDNLYRIGRSKPGMGLGLFTRVPIDSSEFVIEYTGAKIPTKVADGLPTKYLFEIDEEWTIDGSGRDNIARYVNHSCSPNCEADVRDGRIFFEAVRDIEIGEELSIDYGEEYFDEFIRPFGCKCEGCSSVPTK